MLTTLALRAYFLWQNWFFENHPLLSGACRPKSDMQQLLGLETVSAGGFALMLMPFSQRACFLWWYWFLKASPPFTSTSTQTVKVMKCGPMLISRKTTTLDVGSRVTLDVDTQASVSVRRTLQSSLRESAVPRLVWKGFPWQRGVPRAVH